MSFTDRHCGQFGLGQIRKDERADVTTDGQLSLSNGTLQRKRTAQPDAVT
jgi:hypothetical protein